MKPEFIVSTGRNKKVQTDSFESIITISHTKNLCSEGIKVINLTGIGIDSSPLGLATAFLEFISIDNLRYTDDELQKISEIIRDIHQRC